jgi:hypothetical protein
VIRIITAIEIRLSREPVLAIWATANSLLAKQCR